MQMGDGGEDLAEAHEINVTPFIDVLLVLLIIFMVAAPLATVDVAVDLPRAAVTPQPRPEKPIYLTLKGDHALALNDAPVIADALPAELDRLSGGDKSQRIFLRGDKSVIYEDLMRTMDTLRDAGYLKIALVALQAAPGP